MAQDTIAAEIEFWQSVKNTKDSTELEAYLKSYPKGKFAPLARLRLKKLAVGIFLTTSGASTKRQPGQTFRECPDCPAMIIIPSGSFMMGSPKSEKKRHEDEGPQSRVTIEKPFAVGKFEVTRGEFAAFVKATGHQTKGGCRTWTGGKWETQPDKSWRSPGFAQDDNHPVTCVNWQDAGAYAKWLSGKTGKTYRLPSEAEWEYAARAGTKGPFSFKGKISASKANYDAIETYDGSAKGQYRAKTVPVDSFDPNPFGLYNVHGNVSEWTGDCWNDSYRKMPVKTKQTGAAWTAGNCNSRVVRGGSWYYDPRVLRSAFRSRLTTDNRYNGYGFRLARTL